MRKLVKPVITTWAVGSSRDTNTRKRSIPSISWIAPLVKGNTKPDGAVKTVTIVGDLTKPSVTVDGLSGHMKQVSIVGDLVGRPKRAKLLAKFAVPPVTPDVVMVTIVPHDFDTLDTLIDVSYKARAVAERGFRRALKRFSDDTELAPFVEQLLDMWRNDLDDVTKIVNHLGDVYTALAEFYSSLDFHVVSNGTDGLIDTLASAYGYPPEATPRWTPTKWVVQLTHDVAGHVTDVRYSTARRKGLDNPTSITARSPEVDSAIQVLTSKRNAFRTKSFTTLMTSFPTRRDEREFTLAATLSRIYATSHVLSLAYTRGVLTRTGVRLDDVDALDTLFGHVGRTITTQPGVDVGPFATFTRFIDGDAVVLPLESTYDAHALGSVGQFTSCRDYIEVGDDGDVVSRTRLRDIREKAQAFDAALSILELSSLASTELVEQLLPDAVTSTLRQDTLYRAFVDVVTNIVSATSKSSKTRQAASFVLVAMRYAQRDVKLRHLLAQLALLTAVRGVVMGTIDADDVAIVTQITSSDVTKFGDLPALNGYIAELQIMHPELGLLQQTENVDVSDMSITTYRAIDVVWRHVYDEVVARLDELLVADESVDVVMTTKDLVIGDITTKTKAGTTPKSTKDIVNASVRSTSLIVGVRDIMTAVVQLIDSLEDAAGGRDGTRHVIDESGRTRHMGISPSTRFVLVYDLFNNIAGGRQFVEVIRWTPSKGTMAISLNTTTIEEFTARRITRGKRIAGQITTDVVSHKDRNTYAVTDVTIDSSNDIDVVTSRLRRDTTTLSTAITALRTWASGVRSSADALDDVLDDGEVNESFRRVVVKLGGGGAQPVFARATTRDASAGTAGASQEFKTLSLKHDALGGASLKSFASIVAGAVRSMRVDPTRIRETLGDLMTRSQVVAAVNDMTRVKALAEVTRDAEASATPFVWSSVSSNRVAALRKYMASLVDRDGVVATIGLPTGLVDQLPAPSNAMGADLFGRRGSDVVTISLEMHDELYEDVVFKPVERHFEVSRFVRDESYTDDAISRATLTDALEHFVTFDTSTSSQGVVQRVSDLIANPSYSHISPDDVRAMVTAHIVDDMANLFVKLTTGLDVSHHTFTADVASPVDVDHDEVVRRMHDVLAKRHGQNVSFEKLRSMFPALDEMLKLIEKSNVSVGPLIKKDVVKLATAVGVDPLFISDVVSLTQLTSLQSVVSSGAKLLEDLLVPKLFDRVFNIVFDVAEFEVDVVATEKTNVGRTALRQLRSAGQLIDDGTGRIFIRRDDVDLDMVTVRARVSRYSQPESFRTKLLVGQLVSNTSQHKLGGVGVKLQ